MFNLPVLTHAVANYSKQLHCYIDWQAIGHLCRSHMYTNYIYEYH